MEVRYSRKQAAAKIGIREDTMKEGFRDFGYEKITGPVEKTGKGTGMRWWLTEAQVQALDEHINHRDRLRMRVLAMGGGVQTTALLLMHLKGLLKPAPDCTMFIDLGWESAETYWNLKFLQREAERAKHPFHWIKGPSILEDMIAASTDRSVKAKLPPLFLRSKNTGKKAQITRDCTGFYKAERMAKEIRALLGVPEDMYVSGKVEIMLGISTDEAHRLNNNSKYAWITNTFPLTDMGMSRTDCINWLKDNGYPVPVKSACLGCPYRPNSEWKAMKNERPGEFSQVIMLDRLIRGGANHITEPLYIHQSLKPIEEVEFDNSSKSGFGNECSGMCAT